MQITDIAHPLKLLLILSESPLALDSGGSVAARDRAVLMDSLAALDIAYVDWNSQGIDTLAPAARTVCRPISIEQPGQNASFGLRLRRRLHTRFGSLLHRGPWFFGQFSASQVERQMRQYLDACNPDVVCFDNIPSTIAWDVCADRKRVYFAHNVEADIVRYTFADGLMHRLERSRMCEHEARIVREADMVVGFSRRDCEALREIAPGQLFVVVPPAFSPPLPQPLHARTGQPYAIIPSNAAWQPNVLSLRWFANEVLPHVSSQVRIVLTGRDQDGFLAGLAREHSRLQYSGLLDREHYEQVFTGANLFINPTRYGSGFQIKLMEALRFGIPVISTAFSNHLDEALTATDDPHRMAEMINEWMVHGHGVKPVDYEQLHRKASAGLQAALDRFARCNVSVSTMQAA